MRKRGVAIPFTYPAPEADINYKFAYEKPTTYNVTGSHALKTSIKTADEHVVDLAIEMPSVRTFLDFSCLRKHLTEMLIIVIILVSIPGKRLHKLPILTQESLLHFRSSIRYRKQQDIKFQPKISLLR